MKTKILKYDVAVQTVLVVINLLTYLAFALDRDLGYLILILQFIIGMWQLTSSGLHLLLQHKSIGYMQWRALHFWGSVCYISLLAVLAGWYYLYLLGLLLVVIIPQGILYAYFWLCRSELHYLQNREFFILR